jgi:hypothetical protein
MVTGIEFPEDRVYNNCKTILTLDHMGHITITYIDLKTGDDLAMAYLGKEEIQWIVNAYMENHDFIECEGKKKEDEPDDTTQTPQPIQPSP